MGNSSTTVNPEISEIMNDNNQNIADLLVGLLSGKINTSDRDIINLIKTLETADELRQYLIEHPDHLVYCYDEAANKMSVEWLRVVGEFGNIGDYLNREVVKSPSKPVVGEHALIFNLVSKFADSITKRNLCVAAAGDGWIDVIKFILNISDHVDDYIHDMLQAATNGGRVDAVDLLLEHHANPNYKKSNDDMDSVAIAVSKNHVDILDRFYMKGVSFGGAFKHNNGSIDSVVRLFDYGFLTEKEIIGLVDNPLPGYQLGDYAPQFVFLCCLTNKLIDEEDEDPYRVFRKFFEVCKQHKRYDLIDKCCQSHSNHPYDWRNTTTGKTFVELAQSYREGETD